MKTGNTLLAALVSCLICSPAWALPNAGSLAGWGWNDDGQTDVPAGNDFVAIAGGAYHGLAIIQEVPEPGSLTLLTAALACLGFCSRRNPQR